MTANARILPVIINRNNVLKIQIFLFLTVFSSALAMKQSPEPFHDIFPNEVVRMFLEHMSSRQRFSVARVSFLWRFLTASFNDVPKRKQHPTNIHVYTEKNIKGLERCINDTTQLPIGVVVDQTCVLPEEQAQIMALACSPKVISLAISHGRLNSEQLAALADNYNLWYLALRTVVLDQSTLNVVADLIDRLPSLKDVRLSENELSDAVFEDSLFGKVLERNTCLKYLTIDHNPLTCARRGALIEAFTINKSIECLRLIKNDIRDDGAEKLALVVAHNTRLKKLSLTDNNITDTGAQSLCKALENNSNLTTLELDRIINNIDIIGSGTIGAIKALLKRNKKLQANSITK